MHLRLFALVMSLLCEVIRMGSGVMQKQSAHRETSEDCQSCLECSRDNGCVRCPERLFLFLQRKGMSHHGTCLHSCPAGHFGQRGRDVNRCMKCRSLDCEHCFSRDFCTKCKPGFKLHKGKCLIHCPEGTYAHQTDCLERRQNKKGGLGRKRERKRVKLLASSRPGVSPEATTDPSRGP
ncbi:R-spondin-4 isoform X2 [Fundulus heteroclitus]|uniref:R-spondin-4 isoform X2 n=1 Tax=Fundulus heteroclitus TaxID=8078 RepID=UPI00165AB9F4|nr:R-spondin-4 isoform X2 [Fundulus heteroclitus]